MNHSSEPQPQPPSGSGPPNAGLPPLPKTISVEDLKYVGMAVVDSEAEGEGMEGEVVYIDTRTGLPWPGQ